MSRNYELLQNAAMERDTVASPSDLRVDSRVPRLAMGVGTSTEIQRLVDRLFFTGDRPSPRSVVFVPTGDPEWSAWLCAHTADFLRTRVLGTICAVDANLYSPQLHSYFPRKGPRGLTDLIRDPAKPLLDAASPVDNENLYLLPSGAVEGSSGDLLRSDNLRVRIDELRQQFEYVLIAAPPVPLYADVLTLGRLADGVVLIVKARSVKRPALRELTDQLVYSGADILGVMLHESDLPQS